MLYPIELWVLPSAQILRSNLHPWQASSQEPQNGHLKPSKTPRCRPRKSRATQNTTSASKGKMTFGQAIAIYNYKQRIEGDPGLKPMSKSCHIHRAAKAIGMKRITHHDLRHLFATRCSESGVEIPTVSRWLGHKDGGALAMKSLRALT